MTVDENDPPYHLVQDDIFGGKHHGPFSTYLDAILAQHIASPQWSQNCTFPMGKKAFDEHLDKVSSS